MKRSELSEICDKLIQLHIHDLQNELPEIIKKCTDSTKEFEDNMASIIANVAANSVAHSVQAVTDVLVNVGLLDLESD